MWQGQPVPGLHVGPGGIFLSLFGLPFLTAGLVANALSIRQLLGYAPNGETVAGIFLFLFSIPFTLVGLGLVFGVWLMGPIAARRVRYALTDRRAYVAKNYLRRTMETYVIHPDDAIELERGRRADSVYFHAKHGRDSDGDRTTSKIGFENIFDGEAVYQLLRRIQRGDI